MQIKQLLFAFLLTVFGTLSSNEVKSQNNFRIMFYNVENLFDTKNDPDHADEDFLPNGAMKWQAWKYWEKLKNISRVITAVGQMQSPALVGLCEIENDSVIFDLTRRSPLRAQQYEYVVTNSPDERGIDVALLYQRDQFRLLRKHEYQIPFREKNKTSRNILHVVGQLVNKDTLDVFVCHFPSRGGGQLATERSRIDAALLLKRKTDSLFHIRKNANIFIMGDFNDHPDDKSLSQALNARSIKKEIDDMKLYNLFRHCVNEKEFGTYKYQGKWEILDQFIVSGNLLKKGTIEVKNNSAHVFKADFLLEKDKRNGGKRPYRTNLGPRYIGGFSDHLPIYMNLVVR